MMLNLNTPRHQRYQTLLKHKGIFSGAPVVLIASNFGGASEASVLPSAVSTDDRGRRVGNQHGAAHKAMQWRLT
jgi:hypothetical protein